MIDEQGNPTTKQNQGGEELKVNGAVALPYGFRGVVSVDYLSSYLFRLAFGQSFTEAINSEVRSSGFISKSFDGNLLGLWMSRYQNYQSTIHGDVIDIAHIPSLEMAGRREPQSSARSSCTPTTRQVRAFAATNPDSRPRMWLGALTFIRQFPCRHSSTDGLSGLKLACARPFYSERLIPTGTNWRNWYCSRPGAKPER